MERDSSLWRAVARGFFRFPPPALLRASALLFALVLAGCATPTQPTGGPDDTTPPSLISSLPESGAVRVASGEIVLTFSERLNASGARAVQISPQGETPPEVTVRGRELHITVDSLREATTYVVTVTTDLRDARNVPLRAPITLAFSTGDEVDAGKITGRVLNPDTGRAEGGISVWAYAADSSGAIPDARQRPPDYQTETGTDGAFALDYLRPGTFFVAAVRDANRNRQADPGEAFALGRSPLARADTVSTQPLALYLTLADTLAPAPQRARGLSDRRLAVRFDSPIVLTTANAAQWALTDSTSGQPVPLRTAYIDPISPQEVRFETTSPLAAARHRIALTAPGVVTDSSGNGVAPFSLVFTPSDRADTLGVRFIGFGPERGGAPDSVLTLRSDEKPTVRFSAPPGPDRLASISVFSATGTPSTYGAIITTDGLVYAIDSPPEASFEVRVASGDSTLRQRYRRLAPRETGELSGIVVRADSGAVLVSARPSSGAPYTTVADASGRFTLSGLPPGDYQIRFVVDRNGDGTWTGGQLAPFVAPEPLAFAAERQTVRARFETEMGEVDFDGPAPPQQPARQRPPRDERILRQRPEPR